MMKRMMMMTRDILPVDRDARTSLLATFTSLTSSAETIFVKSWKFSEKKSSYLDMGQTHLKRYDRRNVLVKFVSRLVIRRIILRQF